MKLIQEFKDKNVGDWVRLGADRAQITDIIDSGFHPKGRTAIAYWVESPDFGPCCISFDHEGNWIRD